MTFYQELQLNAAGSKALIRITEEKKERIRHVLIYNFKVYLVVAFCFAAVTLFSLIFGNENSIAGVIRSSCPAGSASGRFRNSNAPWPVVHHGNLFHPDDRASSV